MGFAEERVQALAAHVGALRKSSLCAGGVDVVIDGCLQSWKYFDGVSPEVRRLYTAGAEARAAASAWIEGARGRLRGGELQLVGVQVRLGDKVHEDINLEKYAPTNWTYFTTAMRYAEAQLVARRPSARVAFVLTVGGDVEDREAAQGNLTAAVGTDRVLITDVADRMVDYAILSSMDGVVISVSTFGWWAAYVSDAHVVVAPRNVYLEAAGRTYENYRSEDAYPKTWKLIDNS